MRDTENLVDVFSIFSPLNQLFVSCSEFQKKQQWVSEL